MKQWILILALIFVFRDVQAQTILAVPTVTQEKTEWCWAGCSKSLLFFYGTNVSQCQIAEYTRTMATWHSYGVVDCCVDPDMGCNYPNYLWGADGSIENILLDLGSLQTLNNYSPLSYQTIITEIDQARPFIVRWGWTNGGGHFVIGKGYKATSNSVYYMNPWPGEGAKVATYAWLVNDGSHNWTHTLQMAPTPSATAIAEKSEETGIVIYPNPATELITIEASGKTFDMVELNDVTGKSVYQSTNIHLIDLGSLKLSKGLYILKLSKASNHYYKKIIIH
jgi:hypothetical protein